MAKQTAKTPDEGFQRLKADLKNGEFQNFYIFCGEEAYLREHYLRLLTGKLTGGPAGAFNEHRFNEDQIAAQLVRDVLSGGTEMPRDPRGKLTLALALELDDGPDCGSCSPCRRIAA